ncbi:MAG: DNA gyrase inhibitor YacG [Candidatus Puniceispirillaceae bacterium]
MAEKIITLSEVKQKKQQGSGTKCPQCGSLAVMPHKPFCSRRCAQIDLGKWLNEDYRVPADEVMDDSDIEALIATIEKDGDH